ncbi:hypothetical protein VNO77_29378 [Canavalia gladiata]|uniref:C3H1-type domain-containing protein n=1 Tax=Canavalia gladiata TaxID=3824 RepID=A0AAN9Q887_CANGL
MEREAWGYPQTHGDFKNPNDDRRKLKMKTELCRKFKQGACALASKCNYAHGVAELRYQPKLCRLFLHNTHCPYGRSCRFLHSTPNPPAFPNAQHSSAPPPTIDAQYNILQTTCAAAATNASITTVTTTSSPKDQPSCGGTVKSIFNKNQLLRNSRIYADWI